MTVRFRLALTVLLTGLASAIGCILMIALAFQHFEQENIWQRGDAFLGRVATMHADLLEQHRRNPQELDALLHALLLYEPASQLYLLDADGLVLASTGRVKLAQGFKVAIEPVRRAAAVAGSSDGGRAAYVMGDDPEYMDSGAVIAARALRSTVADRSAAVEGYLYLVCRRPGGPAQQLAFFRSTVMSPALLPVLAVIVLATALAAWIIVTVTRPLRVLSDEVAAVARAGFSAEALRSPLSGEQVRQARAQDEFGRLRSGFQALLGRLGMQWDELKRLDQFRRESVSNLSHDLRSPLTATVACLETLEQRWPAAGDSERRLIEVALRNTRNAAAMVRALGDLALLDEPQFQLHPMRLDITEVLDDIVLRFADRAARQNVVLRLLPAGGEPTIAEIDVELIERALANLLDNALKFTPAGGAVDVAVERVGAGLQVSVSDQGRGIAAADLPHLFDRLYQSRGDGPVVADQHDEGSKGLGLAIVKRIVELHGGTVAVSSQAGQGTTVTMQWPASLSGSAAS